MTLCATLLMDLQVDFLSPIGARMPVDPSDALRVINVANAVLAGKLASTSLPIFIVNEFPKLARIGNFFRRGAAVVGTPGANLDPRLTPKAGVRSFSKSSPSAFSNPDLEPFLKANAVRQLYVIGVFAEGCVRATAIEGVRKGFDVVVPLDAIGTNNEIKRKFAKWAMRRAGVTLIPSLPSIAKAA